MENSGKIFSDSYCASLVAEIKIPVWLKFALCLFYFVVVCFVVFILSLFDGADGPKTILLPAIGICVLLLIVGKYVSWNLFGKESITVTTKSISYYRDYGVFKMSPKVILFNFLATNTAVVKEENEKQYGVINFFDRYETTMQLKPIFTSTINLPMNVINEMDDCVHSLFEADAALLKAKISQN